MLARITRRARWLVPILIVVAAIVVPDHWPDGASRIELLDFVFRHLGATAATIATGVFIGIGSIYFAALIAAAFAVALGTAGRAFALRRLRAHGVDPFAKARARFEARPASLKRASMNVAAAVAALATFITPGPFFRNGAAFAGFIPAVILAGLALAALTRAYVRHVIAPFDNVDTEPPNVDEAEGMLFSAVAVTREARAIVAAFSVASLGVLAYLASADLRSEVVLGYAVAAVAAAVAFSRMSRIAVGVDGVLVAGTSRTRFLAYRDLDEASISSFGDLVLKKEGRVVLRLQIHGNDAPRTRPILERLQRSIAAAADAADDGAQRLAGRSPETLALAARGDGNYRAPGATRDELWEIVESGASTAPARSAAARALAEHPTAGERRRLRIAAEQCVDPVARAALLRIAPPALADGGRDERDAERDAAATAEATATLWAARTDVRDARG